jgi:hypothetical protein
MLGIEAGQDVAEMIMGRGAVGKRPQPPPQFELPVAEPGDVGDRLGTGQHGKQAQQEHLIERVDHLIALARVRQILEMAQENDRLVECTIIHHAIFHRRPPQMSQRTQTDEQFIPLSRLHSPDCPVQTADLG